MKIKNPTENEITIQFRGVKYSIEANGELKNIPQDVADFWKTIHPFLNMVEDTETILEPKKVEKEEGVKEEEKAEEKVEEKVEEEKETEKVTKDAKKTKKSKK